MTKGAKKGAAKKGAAKKGAAKKGAASAPGALPCVPGTYAKWVVEPDGSATEYVWDKNCNPIRKDLYQP